MSKVFILFFLLPFSLYAQSCDITMTTNGGDIQISGLVGENLSSKIFTENWELVWECAHWSNQCNETEIIADLEIGVYKISIETADCNFYEEVSTVPASTCGFHYISQDSFDQVIELQELPEIPVVNLWFEQEGMDSTINLSKHFDGQVIWQAQVDLDYNGTIREAIANRRQPGCCYVVSGINFGKYGAHDYDDGKVIFSGIIFTPQAEPNYLYVVVVDEANGNLISKSYYEYGKLTTVPQEYPFLRYYFQEKEIIHISFKRQSYITTSMMFDLQAENVYPGSTISSGPTWNYGFAYSKDEKSYFRWDKGSGITWGFDRISLEPNGNNVSLNEGVGYNGHISLAFLADEGVFINYRNRAIPSNSKIVKLDADGNEIWRHNGIFGDFVAELDDGSIILRDLVKSRYFYSKLDGYDGTIFQCDCNVNYALGDEMLLITDLRSENVAANIFDTNGNLMWSCNSWSTPCTHTEKVALPPGDYFLAVQSEVCDIYEPFTITDANIDVSCLNFYPYDTYYYWPARNHLNDIQINGDGLSVFININNECTELILDENYNELDQIILEDCPPTELNYQLGIDTIGVPFNSATIFAKSLFNIEFAATDNQTKMATIATADSYILSVAIHPNDSALGGRHSVLLERSYEGELLWMRYIEGYFYHRSTLENGDYIFLNYHDDGFDLLRLNNKGKVVGCETVPEATTCDLEIIPDIGQLILYGLVGEDINVNVFNENNELIWSCSDWSTECNLTEIIPLSAGIYNLAVQSSLCDHYSEIEILSGLIQGPNQRIVSTTVSNLYPNPATDQLFINLNAPRNEQLLFEIIDISGQVLFSKEIEVVIGFNQMEIPIDLLVSGLYCLNIIGMDMQSELHKFLKK